MSAALPRSTKPSTSANESGTSDAKTSSPSSSPNMSGQRSSGRIGLSEYTAQRLAELRARRAEAEADFKQGMAGGPPNPQQDPAATSTATPSPPTTATAAAAAVDSPSKLPKATGTPTRQGEATTTTDGQSKASSSSVNGDSPAREPSRRPLAGGGGDGVTRPVEPAPAIPVTPNRSAMTTSSSAADGGSGSGTVRTQRSPTGNEKKFSVSAYSPSPSHSRSGAEDDDDVIGFASLPEQVHRKAVKRGFDFTLMVVGESGLGKSTLISCLFMNNDLYKGRIVTTAEDRISKTVTIDRKSMDIEERGVKLRLTIVDTPGFNEMVDATDCWTPIEEYIDQQYEQYLNDESGLNRKNIKDSRVHCCLYFLSPCSHGLRQIDVELMKRLQKKVNLVPIIAKSDTLTPMEIKRLKATVRAEIEKQLIRIYEFPDCDSDEDEEFKRQDSELKSAVPFAVVGSNTIVEVGGRKIRGRLYPWGIVEVDNPNHSDFVKLRQFLISTHMQDLKDITRDVHYENYRARHIQEQMTKSQKERTKLKRDSTANFDSVASADELLQQKDQELQQMREMLKKMESQLAGTKGDPSSSIKQAKGLGNL